MKINTEKTEIALKQASNEVSIFLVDVKAEVAKIVEKYKDIVPDASNKEGYQFCKDVRGIVLPIKTGIEKARKELKAPIIAAGKLIDGSLNPLADELDEVYKPFESAYREVDNAKKIREEKRQAKIQESFSSMESIAMQALGQTSTVIETMIEDLECLDFSESIFQERTNEAVKLQSDIHTKLTTMLKAQVAAEEQEAKAEEMRLRMEAIEAKEAEIAEKERQEQQRIIDIAAAKQKAIDDEAIRVQAKADAEAQHKLDMEAAEARRIQQAAEAEEQAKAREEAARVAESNRLEAIKAKEEAEAKAREANKANKAKVHNAILAEILKTGITDKQAKDIITLAAKGLAGNMRITY